jgi:aerobic C4-dicarboxylate transport protein
MQVLTAIVICALLGFFYPSYGAAMKPLGAFIAAIRMVIALIIFCTVVHGIASMKDMRKVGRVGLKALIDFEVMTTVALVLRAKRVARHAAVNGIARLCRTV